MEVELLAIAELNGGIECVQRWCMEVEAGVVAFIVHHEAEPEAERRQMWGVDNQSPHGEVIQIQDLQRAAIELKLLQPGQVMEC